MGRTGGSVTAPLMGAETEAHGGRLTVVSTPNAIINFQLLLLCDVA